MSDMPKIDSSRPAVDECHTAEPVAWRITDPDDPEEPARFFATEPTERSARSGIVEALYLHPPDADLWKVRLVSEQERFRGLLADVDAVLDEHDVPTEGDTGSLGRTARLRSAFSSAAIPSSVSDAMVEAGLDAYSSGGCTRTGVASRHLVREILTAGLAAASKGGPDVD